MDRNKRLISTVLSLAAAAVVTGALITSRLSEADQLSSVFGLLIVLTTYLFGLFTRAEPKTLSEIRDKLADQIDAQWGSVASDSGIYQFHFLPPRLCRAFSADGVLPDDHAPAWDARQYQRAVAGLAGCDEFRRAVVVGPSGGGKSTFALMLARGLRHRDPRKLPLLLSLNSWSPEDESFGRWLDRQLTTTYRAIETMGPDRIRQLVQCDDVLVILDAMDRLGESHLGHAIQQINKVVPLDRPLLVLSRPTRHAPLATLAGTAGVVWHLRPATTPAVHHYLSFMASRHRDLAGWQVATDERRGPALAVRELLRSPLFLDMALRVYRSPDQVRTFLDDVRDHTIRQAKRNLIDRYLATLGDDEISTEDLDRLRYVAHRLGDLQLRSIAWWRVGDAIPSRVLAVGAAVSLLPAYWLALLMPQGLTRGLAIGTFTGVLIGITRTRRLRGAAGWAALGALLIVGAVGAARATPAVAIADAVQIPAAVAMITLGKNAMIVRRVRDTTVRFLARATGAVLLTGLVPAALLGAVHARWPAVGVDRSFGGVWLAVAFGVTVAVLSARLLVPLDQPLRPSRVTLRSRGTRLGTALPHLAAAIASAVTVGVAGGVVGALRDGVAYGATLTVFFGLVAGVPIGIAGGVLRWLNQPTVRHVIASPVHTLRGDWWATAGCLATVGASSAASIATLLGPLHPVTAALGEPLLVRPAHGVLFGTTIGLVVACYYTAAPGFLIAVCWLRVRHRLPLRLMRFLRRAEAAGLLRQIGALHEFRHEEIRTRLAAQHHGDRSVSTSKVSRRPGGGCDDGTAGAA